MKDRLELQALLEQILDSPNVYFQPPENLKMQYPCIRYQLDYQNLDHADNLPYRRDKRYLVTVIDQKPDSAIPDKIAELPMCRFSRFYTAGYLNHTVFNLYF